MSFKMTQNQYTSLYGPTVGDSIRLGDTNLFAQIEKDYAVYGEEATFGGGKSIRDGMAQNPRVTRDDVNVADLVISNAVIIDYDKVVKADIGIKNGYIFAIGNAGNPDIMDNVDIIIGSTQISLPLKVKSSLLVVLILMFILLILNKQRSH